MPIIKEKVEQITVPTPSVESSNLKKFPEITTEGLWIILLVAVIYFFRNSFLSLLIFTAKFGLVLVFAYFTYILV